MGPELGLRQYSLNRGLADPQFLGEFATRPMRTTVGRLLLCPAQNARLHGRGGRAGLTSPMLSLKTGDTALLETALPLRHGWCTRPKLPLDFAIAQPIGQRQDQTRPKHIAGGQGTRLCPALQLFPLFGTNLQQSSIIGHVIETLRSCCRYHRDSALVSCPNGS
jgi:hypothetical protein